MKPYSIVKSASVWLDKDKLFLFAYMYCPKKKSPDNKSCYRWEGRIESRQSILSEIEDLKTKSDWTWPGIEDSTLGTNLTGIAWLSKQLKNAFEYWPGFMKKLNPDPTIVTWPLDNYKTEYGEKIKQLESKEQLLSLKGKRLSRIQGNSFMPHKPKPAIPVILNASEKDYDNLESY